MNILTPETRVGMLTLLTILALVYLSMKTAGVPLFGNGSQMTFYMNFNTVAGVELKSKIRLSGVEIGYVDDVELKENFARVVGKLNKKTSIRTNAIATIRTEGLLGEKYIEIVQGTADAPALKDGQTLAKTQDPADISDMLNKLGSALDDVKAVTGSFQDVFGTVEGKERMKNILANIDDSSENIKLILKENREALSATIANINEAAKNIKLLLDENRDTLTATISNFSEISGAFADKAPAMAKNLDDITIGLKEMIGENKESLRAGISNLEELTAEFKEILKENRQSLKTTMTNIASASGNIDTAIESIKNMSGSIERVSNKVESGEGTIGKLISDEEVYDNLNSALSGANSFLNKADNIRLALGFRGESQTDRDNNNAYASLKIMPREDKYYLLEVSEDTRRTDLSTTRNTLNSLLYTILIAKRYSDVTIRGGLIESSAGAGVEYHAFSDSVTLSADIFNISGYDGTVDKPQLKARLQWNFLDYMFLYAGGDELLNEPYKTWLVGAGIMFDENDLKLALGLL